MERDLLRKRAPRRHRPTLKRYSVILLMAALAAFALTSCGDGDTQSLRGQVVAVEADDIVEWDWLTVRADDGRELTFLRGDGVDLRFWRASHLREHQRDGVAIVVFYEAADEGLVARSIEDAA